MKKYGMLAFLLFAAAASAFAYYSEDRTGAGIGYNYPEVRLHTDRYGDISNIIWSGSDEEHIIFLAEKSGAGAGALSTLYMMDVNTGEVKELYSFETHDILKGFMQHSRSNDFSLYTASPGGINEIRDIRIESNYEVTDHFYSLDGFDNANSAFIADKIYFTKADDNLLCMEDVLYRGFGFFYNNSVQKGQSRYLKRIDKVLLKDWGAELYYTRSGKDGIGIYKLIEEDFKIKEEPVAANVVSAKPDFWGRQITGLYDRGRMYGVYWTADFLNNRQVSFTDGLVKEIPKNNDLFGQIPDVQVAANLIFYTRYDEDGRGTIFTGKKNGLKTAVVKDEPIVGPLRVSRQGKKILYFTYEDEEVRVKVYDTDSEKTEDITGAFVP